MKIAFIYGPFCLVDRKFNFSDIWNYSQGLTGSELSYLKIAKEMSNHGHDVSLYTLRIDSEETWEGLHVFDYEERGKHEVDIAISWNDTEPLRCFDSSVFRIVSWQLNQLNHVKPDVDNFVDLWLSPSKIHRDMMISGLSIGVMYGSPSIYNPDPNIWKILPHGCEPFRYHNVDKISGRVIWASSPCRGLHWLLQEWPKIKKAVPYATLRIFYGLEKWYHNLLGPHTKPSNDLTIIEQRARARYIQEAVRKLKNYGVEVIGSISRNQIDHEMAEAEVLAYSCDPVIWTEGFSIALMEACAARACPITTEVDALPSIYGNVLPMIPIPVKEHIGEFSDLVIRALTDEKYKNEINDKAESFAQSYSWSSIVNDLEGLIKLGMEYKRSFKSELNKKLRVAFFFPLQSIVRPIDPNTIWDSFRGLTGSELSCIMYALGLANLGHSVNLFTRVTHPGLVKGVHFLPYEEWDQTYKYQDWDALCSWMLPDPLKDIKSGPFRFVNQQVSEISMFDSDWESYVDILAPLSNTHANYIGVRTRFPRDKWRILHNGVDTNTFAPGKKEPGKMIWASSHDRGLHRLLEIFPEIKRAVPHANLHIFYDFAGLDLFSNLTPEAESKNLVISELVKRSKYTLVALRKLEGRGVYIHKSVSRNRIKDEMRSAEILAYPCDPVAYTETFGVTVLEACASGTVPILCTADSFGELWGSVGLNVPPPYESHKEEFTNYVIEVLNNQELRESLSKKCIEHARLFDWSILVKRFEECLLTHGEKGLTRVKWGPQHQPPPALYSVSSPLPDLIQKSIKLNIACGPNVFPFSDWINYDRVDMNKYFNEIKEIPVEHAIGHNQKPLIRYLKDRNEINFQIYDLRQGFPQHQDGSIDSIYLGQVVEHLNPIYEISKLLSECYRMLKPRGVLRIATPDLDILIRSYLNGDMDKFANEFPDFYKNALSEDQLSYILYGSAGPNSSWDNYDGHMHIYTIDSMVGKLRGVGFKDPFFSYKASGESQCPMMAIEVADIGMGHSFIIEAVK